MIALTGFLIGFTFMVAACAAFTWATVGCCYVVDELGWRFRRGSLAREAQRELSKARVRARAVEFESLR